MPVGSCPDRPLSQLGSEPDSLLFQLLAIALQRGDVGIHTLDISSGLAGVRTIDWRLANRGIALCIVVEMIVIDEFLTSQTNRLVQCSDLIAHPK